jgi:hypothetical protein
MGDVSFQSRCCITAVPQMLFNKNSDCRSDDAGEVTESARSHTIMTRPPQRKLSASALDRFSKGYAAWSPCHHCLVPDTLCSAAPEDVWAPILTKLAAQAILQVGCDAKLLPGRQRELIYPLKAAPSQRKLQAVAASPQAVAGVPVNEVRFEKSQYSDSMQSTST